MRRTATCRCEATQATCEGEPVRVSVCHCRDCKLRTGSAFAAQARWPEAMVTVTGETREWQRTGDQGSVATYRFCPRCGSTIAYALDTQPGVIAVPLGAFAASDYAPDPGHSIYEERKCRWVEITGDGVRHGD